MTTARRAPAAAGQQRRGRECSFDGRPNHTTSAADLVIAAELRRLPLDALWEQAALLRPMPASWWVAHRRYRLILAEIRRRSAVRP